MESQRRLQSDPNDVEALLTLQEIQMKMQNWCQSNVKPGQFTGELVKNLLPKENLQGGFQAWAKKVLSSAWSDDRKLLNKQLPMGHNGLTYTALQFLCFYTEIMWVLCAVA